MTVVFYGLEVAFYWPFVRICECLMQVMMLVLMEKQEQPGIRASSRSENLQFVKSFLYKNLDKCRELAASEYANI